MENKQVIGLPIALSTVSNVGRFDMYPKTYTRLNSKPLVVNSVSEEVHAINSGYTEQEEVKQ